MNKAELVAAVAEKAEISKKDAEAAVKAFTDVVAEELKKGEKLDLVLSRFLREQQELEETHRQSRKSQSQLLRHRSLKQVRL